MTTRALSAMRDVRRPVLLTALIGTLGGASTIVIMALLAEIVDRVFLRHAERSELGSALMFLLAAIFLRATLVWLQEVSAKHTAIRFKRTLRAELFTHLLQLGPAYTNDQTAAEVSNVVTEGLERLDPYVARYLPQTILCISIPLLTVAAVFTRDWVSAAILLATAPILPLLMILVGSYAQRHIDRQWSALSRMNVYFLDALQGLPTLKLFGRSGAERVRMAKITESFSTTTMQVLRYAFLSALVLEFITAGAIALVAVELGTRLIDGSISFDRALFILLMAPEYFRPLRDLGVHRHAAMEGKPALERIGHILSMPLSESERIMTTAVIPAGALTISLHGVSLTYPDSKRPALEQIDLEMPAGTRTALVGRSGAGKSTLVNLLLRFLEPGEGQVLADGVPITALSPERWREYVAFVPQRPYLFAGSVYENIAMGRRGASKREIERAAAQAGAAEFIERLSKGYETQVGERGSLLSGGEAQRIAIARAFLKDAPILVLDEPTSSLDPTNEALIRVALERLMQGRTVLVVAHRLNTIYTAEQIAVLDQGHLVEIGTHEDLLRRDGVYSSLVKAGTQVRA